MKTYFQEFAGLVLAGVAGAVAWPAIGTAAEPSQPAAARSEVAQSFTYEQKLYAPPTSELLSPEQAQAVVARFREAYARLGQPRVLIFVNRTLVDSGAREGREDNVASTETAVPAPVVPTLADRQTVRDVERLFGRPLRLAGATLIDQGSVPVVTGESADKADADPSAIDREAVAKVADVVIEVLISSRTITLREGGEEVLVGVPDIQATAIRLSDAQVLGQASATDVLGHDHSAARKAQRFGVGEIVEATAFALMEDVASMPEKK